MSQIRSKQIFANATGDLLVGVGSNFSLLPIGTTGQVLTVSGGTASWSSPSVPNAFIYRGTVNAANNLLPQVGTPQEGDYYSVIATGNTQNFNGTWDANSSPPFIGATFKAGDAIVYNGSTWDKFDNNDPTVVGTTNEIDVSYDSLNEQYTVSISGNYAGSTSITTLGTVSTGTWQAGIIARQFGGTGSDTSSIGANRLLVTTGTTTTSGVVAPTSAGTFLAWNGTAFVWTAASTNAYSTITGDSGSSTAVGADTLAILGGLGLVTISADGSPDSLTINTDIATNSVLKNNVGTGSAQLGIRGPNAGTILQATGSSSEAAWSTFTLPSSIGAAGTFLQSNGTNLVSSTLVLPTSATAPAALVVNSTNTVTAAGATASGQVLTYNGTTVGFAALSYNSLINTPTDASDETVVATGGANLTLTNFFSNVPLAASIIVFFNGLRLRNSGYTVSGQNLTLVDSVNGYAAETNDVITSNYQF